jgi:uncharacterized protein YgbK (DUF1537 family)
LTDPRKSGLLYAYYGDDFTGSTDVLEALALNGISAVLFTHSPEQGELAAFTGCRAIGVAGESRSRDPQWMTDNLPEVFESIRGLGAPFVHYKVCSTFDSAPHVGSIGRAIELGRAAFEPEFVPVVVGAPHLGRSVVYGNLFAAAEGKFYRIDRHPTMSRHPVTPMNEADLRLHLARQTTLRMGLVDLAAFQAGCAGERLAAELARGAEAVVFDGLNDEMLDVTAQMLWERACVRPVFAVGSSGLTYGLQRIWGKLGFTDSAPELPRPAAADRLLVLCGSCSPITEGQIRRAMQQGFVGLHLKGAPPWETQAKLALEALACNQSVVLYTALGPQSKPLEAANTMGAALGELLRDLLLASGVRRIVVAGGDTSSHAVRRLGLDALTFIAPLAPGAPLCRGHAKGLPLDGLELVLKGGQVGQEEFFSQVLGGG